MGNYGLSWYIDIYFIGGHMEVFKMPLSYSKHEVFSWKQPDLWSLNSSTVCTDVYIEQLIIAYAKMNNLVSWSTTFTMTDYLLKNEQLCGIALPI